MPSARPSPFPKAALVAFGIALVGLSPREADAQACCAGASALGSGRLTLHEEALVGADARVTDIVGSFANDAEYRASSTTRVEFEQGIFGSLRLFEKAQLSLRIPFVETYHRARNVTEFAGGIGDIQLSSRYDFLLAGESLTIPGIGLSAGLIAPTGRPVERATKLLGSDTTGAGAFQLSLGASIEQTFDNVYVGLFSNVDYRLPRQARGRDVPGAVQLSETLALGWIFSNEAVVVLSSRFNIEPEASKRILRLGLSSAMPLSDTLRVQGGIFGDLPVTGLGRNQSAGIGFQLAMMRSWS